MRNLDKNQRPESLGIESTDGDPERTGGPRSAAGKVRSSQNSLRHGLYSRTGSSLKLRSRRTRRLVANLREVCPWLNDSDMPTVRAWAELEIVSATVFTVLEADGVVSGPDKSGDLAPRRLLNEYRQLKATQLQYARELGLTPSARAALGLDVARGQLIEGALERVRYGAQE